MCGWRRMTSFIGVLRTYSTDPRAGEGADVTIGDVHFSGRAGFIEVEKAHRTRESGHARRRRRNHVARQRHHARRGGLDRRHCGRSIRKHRRLSSGRMNPPAISSDAT